MSANGHDSSPEETHNGPIKTPKQVLMASLAAFLVPIFIIIGLVYNVTSQDKPQSSSVNAEKAVAERIQKVGYVEIRDANRPLRTGEEVYKAQCSACHAIGAVGAPKFQDAAAWAPRIAAGYDALLKSALKGKNAMGAQGGGVFTDLEVGRAVVYMANAAGAKFAEPAAPAAPPDGIKMEEAPPGAAASAPAAAAAPTAPPAAPTPATAAPAAAPVVASAAAGGGEVLYKQTCSVCHAAGVAGAPKFGDKAAWAPRIAVGFEALLASATKGKGAMPPKGGSAASDADFKAAVQYMVNAAK